MLAFHGRNYEGCRANIEKTLGIVAERLERRMISVSKGSAVQLRLTPPDPSSREAAAEVDAIDSDGESLVPDEDRALVGYAPLATYRCAIPEGDLDRGFLRPITGGRDSAVRDQSIYPRARRASSCSWPTAT